jgi:hypothetical protein
LFWATILSGADDRIVYGANWLAKNPQEEPIPSSIGLGEARLTLKGLSAILATAPSGNLRLNALARMDQLVRTKAGWNESDVAILDEADAVLDGLSPRVPERTRNAVKDLRNLASGTHR